MADCRYWIKAHKFIVPDLTVFTFSKVMRPNCAVFLFSKSPLMTVKNSDSACKFEFSFVWAVYVSFATSLGVVC